MGLMEQPFSMQNLFFPNNKIFDKHVFATPRPGKPDGIKVDEYGNVFSSAWDGVQIFTPEGDLMAKIQIAEQRTANLCFGGNEFNKTIQ